MKKNLKFIHLMSRLNQKEVSAFWKHLKHGYPKEGNALKVYRYYMRFFPENSSSPKLDVVYAFDKIYEREMRPGMEDKKKLWNDMSKLYLWLKDFLVMNALLTNKYLYDTLWLKFLSEKNAGSEYAKQVTEMHDEHTGKPLSDMGAFLRQMEVALHLRKFLMQDQPAPDHNALPGIVEIKESADLISIKMECERLTIQAVKPSKKGVAQGPVLAEQPLVRIYQEILPMLMDGDEQHYFEIEALLRTCADFIAMDELLIILRYMQNFAAKMVRKGNDKEWGKRFHELNKTVLEKEEQIPKGIMPAANFLNIVNAACAASDIEWAKEFTAGYSKFLPIKIRQECALIAMATIAFEEKQFKEAADLTKKPKFKEETHMIRAKTLHLRALYESKADTTKACSAFNAYLDRHRTPKTAAKEAAIAFMKVFVMLSEATAPKKKLQKLLKESPELYFRSWLEEKIQAYRSTIYGVDRRSLEQ